MESQKLQKIGNYQKKLKKLLGKNLQDIILFGSYTKRGFPNDIDMGLVVEGEGDLSHVKKEIRDIFPMPVDFQIININSIYSPMWLTLIKEGFSIKKNAYLHDLYRIEPLILFKYSLKSLTNVQKVQFSRGIKNLLKNEGEFVTRSVVLVPIKAKDEFIEFLRVWNIHYESKEFELLPLLRKEEFI